LQFLTSSELTDYFINTDCILQIHTLTYLIIKTCSLVKDLDLGWCWVAAIGSVVEELAFLTGWLGPYRCTK